MPTNQVLAHPHVPLQKKFSLRGAPEDSVDDPLYLCDVVKATWFVSDLGQQWNRNTVKDNNWYQVKLGFDTEDKNLRPIACKMACILLNI